jgi:two-component system, response regulator
MNIIPQTIVDILLVEDDPRDAELIVRTLKKNISNNNIIHVNDGDEAINYFFNGDQIKDFNKPKLILLDLKLPKISGIEVLKKLKGNQNTKYIPITILTSSKQENDLSQCYEIGANSYIVKSVTFEIFVTTIKEVGNYWILYNQLPQSA